MSISPIRAFDFHPSFTYLDSAHRENRIGLLKEDHALSFPDLIEELICLHSIKEEETKENYQELIEERLNHFIEILELQDAISEEDSLKDLVFSIVWGLLIFYSPPFQKHLQHAFHIKETGKNLIKKIFISNKESWKDFILHDLTPIKKTLFFSDFAKEGNLDLLRLALLIGLPIEGKNLSGSTLLNLAAQYEQFEIADYLVKHKAELNTMNDKGISPLKFACLKHRLDLVHLLLDSGADPDLTDPETESTALHFAAELGMPLIVRTLIQQEANPNKKNKFGQTPLILATQKKQIKVVFDLLHYKANIHCQAEDQRYPLYFAIESQFDDMVELLMKHEADPTLKGPKDWTCLHLAASLNRKKIFPILMASFSSISDPTKEGAKPLHIAIRNRADEIAFLLIESGHPLNDFDGAGYQPLHLALLSKNESLAKLLIEKGCDLDKKGKNGDTPLHLACHQGLKSIASILIEKEVPLSPLDHKKQTPLHAAADQNHCDIISLLIESGHDMTASDCDSNQPLHVALIKGKKAAAKLLIEKGAPIETPGDLGSTPLHLSCYFQFKDLIELLIEKKANLSALNKDRLAPIHAAIVKNAPEIVSLLLEAGADPNILGKDDASPLYLAAQLEHLEIVKILCAHKKIIVDAPENKKFTPLMIACYKGNKEIVIELLKSGAKPSLCNDSGFTPVHFATENDRVDILDLLVKLDPSTVNIQSKSKLTPLAFSLEKESNKCAEFLIRNKTDFSLTDARKRTPLQQAIELDESDLAHLLIDFGSPLESSGYRLGTPLSMAIFYNMISVVDRLIEKSCPIEFISEKKVPLLHQLVFRKQSELIAYFIKKKLIPLDLKDPDGNSALHFAIHTHSIEMATLLISLDVNITSVDGNQNTPLHLALIYGKEDLALLLIEKGVALENPNVMKERPIHLAAKFGFPRAFEALVRREVKLSPTDKQTRTPLHLAAQFGHLSIVESLIHASVPLCPVDRDLNTPLHLAAESDRSEIVDLLLRKGCRPNMPNFERETPLHKAGLHNSIRSAQILIDYGADLTRKAYREGLTPLDLAKKHEYFVLIPVLSQKQPSVDSD